MADKTVKMTDAQFKLWQEMQGELTKKAEAETKKEQLATNFPELEAMARDIKAVDPKYRAPWDKKSPFQLRTVIKDFIAKQPGKSAKKAAIVAGVKSDEYTEDKISKTLTSGASGERTSWTEAGDVYTLK